MDGKVSVTVTFVADAGPLLVTVSVYNSGVPSVTGIGDAVLTIAISALFAFATITVALAVLLVMFGTIFVAVAVIVFVMLVPEGVPETTLSTSVKVPVLPTARLVLSVQEIVPVPPTGGSVPQVHPAAVIDTNVVFGGVTSVMLVPVALLGPMLLTVCV